MSRWHRKKSRAVEFKDAETSTYSNNSPGDKILHANLYFSTLTSYCYPKEGYADKSTMAEAPEENSHEDEDEIEDEASDIFQDYDANAWMEFTLNNKNIQELERIFGDPNAKIEEGIKSVIKIPLVLAHYVYKSYLENERNKRKKFSKSTPNLSEIMKMERKRNYSVNEESYCEESGGELAWQCDNYPLNKESYREESVEQLRELAWQYDKERQKHQEQANYYRSRKMPDAVKMCGERAKLSSQKSREYHELAAEKVRSENTRKQQDPKTIDLHRLRVREALQALNDFLDLQIDILNETDDKIEDFVRIVTGKGKNSKGGFSKVKQAVITRLEQRKIEYNLLNDGFIKARILNQYVIK